MVRSDSWTINVYASLCRSWDFGSSSRSRVRPQPTITHLPRMIETIPTHSLPDDAHVEFACPFCQRQNLLTPLDTKAAAHVTLTETKISFHAIKCPTCRQTLTFQATLTTTPLPLPPSGA